MGGPQSDMRSMWTGAVTFGLVNVRSSCTARPSSMTWSCNQVHDEDGGRIRYQRRCEVCGEVIAYDHVDRAFEDGGRTVILSDEDLAGLPAEKSRDIEVVGVRTQRRHRSDPTGSQLFPRAGRPLAQGLHFAATNS